MHTIINKTHNINRILIWLYFILLICMNQCSIAFIRNHLHIYIFINKINLCQADQYNMPIKN